MIACSTIGTCAKGAVWLSGCVTHTVRTNLNIGQSTSCCFCFYPAQSRSNYTHLSASKTIYFPSIGSFQMLQKRCLWSARSRQRYHLWISNHKRLLSTQDPLKSKLNISLASRFMNLRLSVSNSGMLSKIKGSMAPLSWSLRFASTIVIFSLFTCYSSAEPSHADSFMKENNQKDECDLSHVKFSHGKKVYTDYSVIGIPGDGRCLFRSVSHGACLRAGKPAPTENLQRELADELRSRVADEFIKRRQETEWFIEGDFDNYVARMRKPHVWGGEPELLMASHVLKMPITVYMYDETAGGLISIAEYGQEYGKENPIRVLYHGFGHYDALRMPGEKGGKSKL
ncbi:hypothetical protein K2173_003806 [Erythroxylum novogranatense]|uniref:Ubiquitin thioesterase OTU n=1 Tax=Erythroxylum novogranatense TaxID=1862640 RepID=A0AAV8SJG8_9ROSI|nr:hypothetical protein K2173_003806 [Erythroxylum novogranatense]